MKNVSTLKVGLLVIMLVSQIAVPASMIIKHENVLRTGSLHKFKSAPVDPVDPLRGRYVAIRYDELMVAVSEDFEVDYLQNVYASLGEDEQGYAMIKEVSLNPPNHDDYLIVQAGLTYNNPELNIYLPYDRFYMEEAMAPEAERIFRSRRDEEQAYVALRVKHGVGVIENLYLGDMPLVDRVKEEMEIRSEQ